NGSQYRAVQRQRTSRDEPSLRNEQRVADRADAGRQVLRRAGHLSRRRGVRRRRRLDQNVIERRGLLSSTTGRRSGGIINGGDDGSRIKGQERIGDRGEQGHW